MSGALRKLPVVSRNLSEIAAAFTLPKGSGGPFRRNRFGQGFSAGARPACRTIGRRPRYVGRKRWWSQPVNAPPDMRERSSAASDHVKNGVRTLAVEHPSLARAPRPRCGAAPGEPGPWRRRQLDADADHGRACADAARDQARTRREATRSRQDLGGRARRITDSQIPSALRRVESGTPAAQVARDLGTARATLTGAPTH